MKTLFKLMSRPLFVLAVSALLLVGIHPYAFAADAAGTVVDFSKLATDILFPIISAVTLVGLGVAVRFLMAKMKITVDDSTRAIIDTALSNAVHFGISKAGGLIDGKLKIDVKNAAIATAVQYASDHVPDAMARFNLDKDQITRLVEVKLTKLVGLDAPAPAAPAAAK